jgi:hypothetical protein
MPYAMDIAANKMDHVHPPIGRHLQYKFAQALAETALHSMPIQVGTLRNTAPADARVIQVDAPPDNRQRTARMRSGHEMTAFDLEGYFDCARAVRPRRARKTIDGRVNQRAAVQTYLDIQRCVSQAQFRFQEDPLPSDDAPPLSRESSFSVSSSAEPCSYQADALRITSEAQAGPVVKLK